MAEAVYLRIIASRMRGQLAYPWSFALDVAAQVIGQAFELITILVIFTQVTTLGGFSASEVVLIYGLAATAFALTDLTVGQVEELPTSIRSGEFDVMLLRPLRALPQLLTADISLKRLGRVAVGIAALGYALASNDIPWSPVTALVAITAPLLGAVILSSIWVAANSVSFWLIDSGDVARGITYGSGFATSYPITVFGPWLRRILCFAVPSAFIAYFPALALLDRPDPLGLPELLRYSAPPVALLCVAVAALAWRSGIRRYQSTGS
ncbi:ABC-2 family transporter protein [Actinomycetes bacterium KLBMP 9759]